MTDKNREQFSKIVGKTVKNVALIEGDRIADSLCIHFTDDTTLRIETSEWVSTITLDEEV